MKTNPWFSTERKEQTDEKDVYHNNTSCLEGDLIEKSYHRYGTDNRPLCKQCYRLDAAGR